VATAHVAVPEANVTWTDDALRRYDSVDVGVAIAGDRGLVTPVLRDVGSTSPSGIAQRVREFVQQANEGKLQQRDLEGGSISVTNLGMYGVEAFSAIINPPQSAILGIHATKERPVVENGQIVIRPMNYLALSYDHRIIDGREAVLSLVAIKEALEDPARLVLEI
jgi:pyruvate dehydrogenase E2 component (dihydrolipoamide acetyltransferase)